MRVLLAEPWAQGGTARYASLVAAALASAEQSVSVELLVPEDFTYRPAGAAMRRVLSRPGRSYRFRAANGVRLATEALRHERSLLQAIAASPPDVVHLLGTAMVTRRLLQSVQRANIPLVVTVHDLPGGFTADSLVRRQWKPYFVEAEAILVHGSWTRKELLARHPCCSERVRVVPFGPYDFGPATASPRELRSQFGLPDAKTILLFFGSLRRNKGLSTLLRALALDGQERFHLFVVGNRPAAMEPGMSDYRREAAELGVADRVTWVDEYVPDRRVPDVFTCSDIVVLPYDGSFRAQSAVLAIAAAYAKPLVVSDVGEMGATVAAWDLGATVAPGREDSLLAALERVADDESFKVKGAFEQFRAENGWDRNAAVALSCYEDLITA